MSTWPIPDEAANEDDIREQFWKRNFIITLSEFGPIVLVNANSEQDALDEAIDYAEEMEYDGLFLSNEEIDEAEADGNIEDFVSGGNHGKYLSSLNVEVKQISKEQALRYLEEMEG